MKYYENTKINFKQRVISLFKNEGWKYVGDIENNILRFRLPTYGYTRIVKVRPHGRLKKSEWKHLTRLGIKEKCHVLFVHETQDHELSFLRVYPIFKHGKKNENNR